MEKDKLTDYMEAVSELFSDRLVDPVPSNLELYTDRIVANAMGDKLPNEWNDLSKGSQDFAILWDCYALITGLLSIAHRAELHVVIDRHILMMTKGATTNLTDDQAVRLLEAALAFVEIAEELQQSKKFREALERMKQRNGKR